MKQTCQAYVIAVIALTPAPLRYKFELPFAFPPLHNTQHPRAFHMADAETSGRIAAAIGQLVDLENTANGEIIAAHEAVNAIARDHARAKADAAAIQAGASAFMADLEQRRKELVAFFAAAPTDQNKARLKELLRMPGIHPSRRPSFSACN